MMPCCKHSYASRLARLLSNSPLSYSVAIQRLEATCVGVVAIEDACQLSIDQHGVARGVVPQRAQREHVPLAVLQDDLPQRNRLVREVADKLPHLHATQKSALRLCEGAACLLPTALNNVFA